MASLQQILSWFKTGLFPNESQFRETWLSFWHKSEKIPQTQIFGLRETIESATQGLIYRSPVATSADLYTTYPNAKTGWAAIVEATGTIWQCEVQSDNTRFWTDTGLREFPDNVATQDDINAFIKADDYSIDFSISDESGNDICQFKNGHIKTKNFNSSAVYTSRLNRVIYEKNLKDLNSLIEFDNLSNWSISNGIYPTATGLPNTILLKQWTSINNKETIVKCILNSNTQIAITYEVSGGYAYNSSYFSIKNGVAAIHNAYTNIGTEPGVIEQVSFPVTDGREYTVNLIKEKYANKMLVYDGVTGAELVNLNVVPPNAGGVSNEFAGGRQSGRLGFSWLGGIAPIFTDVKILSKYIEQPIVVIYGDSISEGDRLSNDRQRYGDLLESRLGKGKVIVSATSGSTISGVMQRMKTELPSLRPKYVMILIGTNGGNTSSNLLDAVNYIKSVNAIPILNKVIPSTGSNQSSINGGIESVVNVNNLLSVRMDIALAINNDSNNTGNSAYFADGLHPNEAGHQAMYDRIKVDVSQLYNY